MNLGNLHWMSRRALSIDLCKGCGAVNRVCDMVDVVGAVEVLAVPAAVVALVNTFL